MADRGALDDEFRTFARYLGWRGTTERLQDTYARLHASAEVVVPSLLDRLLVRLARHGWFAVTLVDAYGRLASPQGLLRRKLVLVLAILEASRASHADYEAANAASWLATWVRLAVIGVRWVLTTLLAIVLIAPMHALILLRRDGASRG